MLGVLALGGAATAVVLLTSPNDSAQEGVGSEAEEEEEEAAAEEQEELEAAEAQALHDACEDAFGGFLSELQELDSRLSVGLPFAEYGEKVGDIRVEYDQVEFGSIDQKCLGKVGVPAEKAFNKYVAAYNIWNRCIGDFGCSLDAIEPEMQERWADATALLSKAEGGLAALEEP